MKRLTLSFFVASLFIFLAACNSTTPIKKVPEISGSSAQLYVFNISGATLFSQNQVVLDNGYEIVSVPRTQYQVAKIATGFHKFTLTYRQKPFVELNAVEGETYYIIVGYRPEKSWAFPLGGDPVVLKQVSQEDAKLLLEQFQQK